MPMHPSQALESQVPKQYIGDTFLDPSNDFIIIVNHFLYLCSNSSVKALVVLSSTAEDGEIEVLKMSLYPSLEDMKVDQMARAQSHLVSQYASSYQHGASAPLPYPTNPTSVHSTSAPLPYPTNPTSAPPPYTTNPPLGNDSMSALYPALNDYMGLELSREAIEQNMPEYAVAVPQSEHLKSVTDNEVCSLLNLGTCGLHVVHGSLRTGVESVDWDISSLLRHMYYLFTDSPARRALFTQLTGCTTFPLKFCGVRWLENAKCFQRALQIWDHVIKFLKEAKLPKTKPVETLKRAACDPFLKCKLAFCKTIADECQPFLQRFQTSKPMTPYLFEAVEKLLRYLMNRCVKPDLMKCTGPKLLSIDTKKSENLILSKNIDIGFATKRLLGETAITVTERQKLEFIHECRSMLTTMIAKLQEKSPLKQKAVRGLSSLDPCVIQHSPQLAQKRFSFLLEELNHANIINDVLAENAKKEYLHFCNLKKSELQEIFRPCDQFSDESINLLVENMHEKTVTAQRHIHDEIQEAGGIKNIHISKKMLDYVRGARKRCHEYLEMKKQERSEEDKKKAEKRKLDIQRHVALPASSTGPLAGMIAPISGHSLGLQRAQVSHGLREVTICKDSAGRVGLRVQAINKGVFVCLVIKDSPAALAGLRFGDQILQINGTVVAGFTMDQVHSLFRKSPVNGISVVVRDRPFERTVTLHKDSVGHIGFQYKNGKIIGLVKDSSAARNGLLTEHHLLEVNGQNVVGLKDKQITALIEEGGPIITITIIPSFVYDHMVKKMAITLVKGSMDHSIPDV
uniref:PDZ domain-containing protein n=1 Tax=Timema monikensis TaxID=170555 RepID=A0A7R9E5A0_9NEOP|nr:unnamed protein product [Timema monikensis]